MISLEKSIKALLAEREHLQHQLNAVDQALAALRGTALPTVPPVQIAHAASDAVPVTRLAPKRVLSEEHKRKLTEGRQRSRQAKEVANGTAREPLDGVPSFAAPNSQAPRLVKRRASRELPVEPDGDAPIDRREEVTH
jgi:hypothetical protein